LNAVAYLKYHAQMNNSFPRYDVVMLGTFASWNLGTLQARAIPLARGLLATGLRAAIVTTPWDAPADAGTIDTYHGIPVINTAAISPSNPFRAVRQQMQWVDRLSPSLVHVFKPKGFGGIAGRFLQHSYPLVVDSDDWEGDGGWNTKPEYSWVQRRVFHHQERDLIRRANQVTAASTLLAERARRLRGEPTDENTHLLENGLDDERITALMSARSRRPSELETPVIVLYSRFAEFEDDWLQRFLVELDSACEAPLIVKVVGSSSVLEVALSLGSKVFVEQMGYVTSQAVPEILGSATLGVYPYRDSLITRSKQSVKLLEQMAAGCPVIASDVGDVARTLDFSGIATTDSSPAHFAREAVRLLDQPERLDHMSAVGTRRIKSRFSFSALSKRLSAIYRAAGLS
jgi:glycosyltransferase involved in cell wall biosynthesis